MCVKPTQLNSHGLPCVPSVNEYSRTRILERQALMTGSTAFFCFFVLLVWLLCLLT